MCHNLHILFYVLFSGRSFSHNPLVRDIGYMTPNAPPVTLCLIDNRTVDSVSYYILKAIPFVMKIYNSHGISLANRMSYVIV